MLYLDEAKSSGIVFNYLVNNRYRAGSELPIRLQGLDPGKRYRIKEVCLYPDTKSTLDSNRTYSGDFLMNVGFNPDVRAVRASVVLQLEEVK